ncbi:hypothetical protein [Streptomyces griseus]|uniref:hypothetical protein n=1 Tax=Streptomyces griseus TaxID=1911 RepID=UPI0005602678|nr:hypothetical protein [Streptomyces griseus]
MARHASVRTSTRRRALVALATAGVALGAGATTAAAAEAPAADLVRTGSAALDKVEPGAGAQAVTDTVGHVTGAAQNLKPNPLAGTGVDPLDNGVGTEVADFRPVNSQDVTGPVTQADSVGEIPALRRTTVRNG